MSENKDEKYSKLREEVNMLKEQLIKIADELEEEPVEPEVQDEPTPIEIEDKGDQEEKEEPPEKDWKKEEDDDDWERKSYSRSYRPDKFSLNPPFMDQLGDYIEDFVEDVMEGVAVGLEESLFINPRRHPRRHARMSPDTKLSPDEIQKSADIMGALSNEHRIKILNELSYGGLYSSDFQEKLKEISPSTLSSHLDVLEEAGFIVQERKRGRYVITLAGRVAVQMAHQVTKLTGKNTNHFDGF